MGNDDEDEALSAMRRRQLLQGGGAIAPPPGAASAGGPLDRALGDPSTGASAYTFNVTGAQPGAAVPHNPNGTLPPVGPPEPVQGVEALPVKAPVAVDPALNPLGAPTAGRYDAALEPYRARVKQTGATLQTAMDDYGQQHFTPAHHGLAYRIAEGLVSALSPAAGNAIFERGDERKRQAWEAGMETRQHQVSSFSHAADQALREMGEKNTQLFDEDRGAYYKKLSENPPKVEALPDIHRLYSEAVQNGDTVEAARYLKAIGEMNAAGHNPPTPLDLNHLYAEAVVKARREGRNPKTDPDAIAYGDAIVRLQGNIEGAKQHERPDHTAVTPQQFVMMETRYQNAIRSLDLKAKSDEYRWTPEELDEAKADATRGYEAELVAAGMTPEQARAKRLGNAQAILNDVKTVKGVPYKFDGKQWVKTGEAPVRTRRK